MTTLTELLERVKGATGADRELDGLLTAALDGRDVVEGAYGPTGQSCWLSRNRAAPYDAYVVWVQDGPDMVSIKCLTASTDSALELTERVLPGWKKQFWDEGVFGSSLPTMTVFEPDFVKKSQTSKSFFSATENAATMPLAILAATLSALIAQEQPNDP